MKKKFRKLIALICALCMLLSNISFAENMEAELQAESGEQTTEVQSETPEEQQAEANPEGGEAEQGEPSQDGSEEQPGEEENQPAESDVQHEDAQQEPEVKPQAPVEEPEKPVVQPETPQEAAHEQQQEGQEPGDQEPADQTDPDEEIPEIKAGTSVNGKVAPDDVYRIRLIPEEDQELVFMLILPSWGEVAIHVSINDEAIDLMKLETEDPEAGNVVYSFEKNVTHGETYYFVLASDWEVPFTMKAEKRQNEQSIQQNKSESETEEGKKAATPEEPSSPEETTTPEESLTPEVAVVTIVEYLPAGELEFISSDFIVKAAFGDNTLLTGTILEAEEIRPGTEQYEQITGITREMISDDWNEMGDEYRVLDIRFMLNGDEIEPQGMINIDVKFRHAIAMDEADSLKVVHVDEDNNAEIVDANTQEKVRNDEVKVEQVSFFSDSFSPYVFVVKKPVTVTIGDRGQTYSITIEYGEWNQISQDADVVVNEIAEGTAAYEAYREKAAEAMNAEDQLVRFSGLYDIKIVDNGQVVQPSGDVKVTMELLNNGTGEDLQVLHFAAGSTAAPEPVDAETEGNTVTFSTDGFSVYGFAYTVDYTYENREYHMKGATSMLLSELLAALGIQENVAKSVEKLT